MKNTSLEASLDISSTNRRQSVFHHKSQRSGPVTTTDYMLRENAQIFESAARDRKLIAPWPDPSYKVRNVSAEGAVSGKRGHAEQSEHKDALSFKHRPGHDKDRRNRAQNQGVDPVAPWKSVPKFPYTVSKVIGGNSALKQCAFYKNAIGRNEQSTQSFSGSQKLYHQGGFNDFHCHTHSSLPALPQLREGCTSALIDNMPLVWPDDVHDTHNPTMHGFNNGQYLAVLRGPTPEPTSSPGPKKKGILRRIFRKKTN